VLAFSVHTKYVCCNNEFTAAHASQPWRNIPHAERGKAKSGCVRDAGKYIRVERGAGIKDSFSNMGGWRIFFPIGYKLYVNTRATGAQNPQPSLYRPLLLQIHSLLSLSDHIFPFSIMLARFCYLKTEFFCAQSSWGVGSTLPLPPPLHTKYTLAHNVRTAAISFPFVQSAGSALPD